MKLRRRNFQRLAASAVLVPAVARTAAAEAYPAQPVHLVVGFAAGQAIDILARLIGQSLSEQLGQQFVVENKPGAGGSIAGEGVAHAAAGRLLAAGDRRQQSDQHLALSQARLRPATRFRTRRRHLPRLPGDGGEAGLPGAHVGEFIAYARAHPGKVNFGSAGSGSVAHVSGELFKMMTGIDMQHVPYRGAPLALADLLAGQVQVMLDNLPSSIDHIRAGRLRALGVSTLTPLDVLPDVPPIAATVPGYETSAFAGLGAPAATPPAVVATLNKAVGTALADPKLKARIVELGGVPMPMTPAEFGALPGRRDREMGQGDPGREHQARVTERRVQ